MTLSRDDDALHLDACDLALGILDATPRFWDGSHEREPLQVALMHTLDRAAAALLADGPDPALVRAGVVRSPFLAGCYRLTAVSRERVLACGYASHRVGLLDADGRVLREADYPFKNPWQAFRGNDGLWWVTNLGIPRLVALDDDLRVVREIRLDEALGLQEPDNRASAGGCLDGQAYLVVSTMQERQYRCLRLDLERPDAGYEEIPLPTNCPRALHVRDGRLYLGRLLPGAAYVFRDGRFTPLLHGAATLELRDFAVLGDSLLVVTPQGVLHTRPGRKPSLTPLAEEPGAKSVPYGIAAFAEGGRTRLFVSDLVGAMHLFDWEERTCA